MPRPSTLHHKALLEEVQKSFTDADVILFLAEAGSEPKKALPGEWNKYVELSKDKPKILLISKIDLLKDMEDLLPLLAQYGEMNVFTEIMPISSKKKHNLKRLIPLITKYLPEGKPFYDPDQLSDQSERFFASEFIREEIFHLFRDEIPYSTEVVINEFAEREVGNWYINADIIVERDSQKSIIIGRGGESLKNLGSRSRFQIEKFVEHPVYLELHVKTRDDWRNDKNRLKDFGYQV
jgi:GTP-binding protein Era